MKKKPLSEDQRLPVVLSILVPGGGQFAQKRVFMGFVFQIALTLIFFAMFVGVIINGMHLFKVIQKGGDFSVGILLKGMTYPGLGLLGIYIWNLVDAHVATVARRKKAPLKDPPSTAS